MDDEDQRQEEMHSAAAAALGAGFTFNTKRERRKQRRESRGEDTEDVTVGDRVTSGTGSGSGAGGGWLSWIVGNENEGNSIEPTEEASAAEGEAGEASTSHDNSEDVAIDEGESRVLEDSLDSLEEEEDEEGALFGIALFAMRPVQDEELFVDYRYIAGDNGTLTPAWYHDAGGASLGTSPAF